MRPRALSLLLLLGAPLTGCDATGGSTDSIVAPKPTFAVQARAPGAGREGVPIAVSISVTFTADIDPSTVTTGVITANDRSFGDLEVDGATLRFTPTGGLVPG